MYNGRYPGADLGGGGGVQGVATPPNGQSHSIKYSTTTADSCTFAIETVPGLKP